jgi:tetratricopeptide (TPR) repeat protein
MIAQYLKMKKIIFPLFIFSGINLIFTCFHPMLRADERTREQINTSSLKPLDYIFSQAEKIKEPSSCCALLTKIASAYTQLGEYAKSEYILTQALDIAEDIENQLLKETLIAAIIEEYINLNKNELALGLLKYIDYADSRQDMLVKIVSGYLQQNQYEKALELTQKINEPSFMAVALYKIIDRLAAQKLFEELAKIQKIVQLQPSSVQGVLRLILREENKKLEETPISNLFASKGPSKKTKALIALAKNKIDLGSPESAGYILAEATLFSENIKGEYIKNECLAQIGMCYVQIGQLQKAHSIAYSMKIPFSRAELLTCIAIGYAEIKEFDTALEVIDDMDVQCLKEKALTQIVILCLEQNQEKHASEIIEKTKKSSARSHIYAEVIKNYLQKKNFPEALKMSQRIENLDIKMVALIEIAKELQKEELISPELFTVFIESLGLSKD